MALSGYALSLLKGAKAPRAGSLHARVLQGAAASLAGIGIYRLVG